ncbi:hypothetical protein [Streptomyces sp. NPDC002851]
MSSDSFPVRPSAPSSAPSAVPPPPCEVPHFSPLRVRGGRYRIPGAVRRRRRATAAGLAMAAAALASTGLRGVGPADAREPASGAAGPERGAVDLVTAPVRIADAETVRLLRPGDRVDVIAAPESGGDASRVVAGARVARVPGAAADTGSGGGGRGGAEGSSGVDTEGGSGLSSGFDDGDSGSGRGALVVLSVPREDAAKLAGAGVRGQLAVIVC